jgi:hypothetical protein
MEGWRLIKGHENGDNAAIWEFGASLGIFTRRARGRPPLAVNAGHLWLLRRKSREKEKGTPRRREASAGSWPEQNRFFFFIKG